MNELDLIRTFRSDVPPPSPAAVTRGRRALQQPPRRRPRLTVRAALATAAAAVVVTVALLLPGDDGGRLGPPDARAAATLRQAATAQQGALARPLRRGEYLYVRRRTAWATSAGDEYTFIQPQISETWVGVDGSGRTVTRPDGPPRFPSPGDRERWQAGGRRLAGQGKRSEQRFQPESGTAAFYAANTGVSYGELLDLPREPRALHGWLRQVAVDCKCGNSVEQETFVIVGDLLRHPPLPSDLRAALLHAAAFIPGIEFVENERDIAGRRGIGVAFEDGGTRSVLVFDRESHELLGENRWLLEDKDYGDAGTLAGASADLESGVVDSITDRP
jgi:hypothetical protein